MSDVIETYVRFRDAAEGAMRSRSGSAVLEATGWLDCVTSEPFDVDNAHAVHALFHAQGRHLAHTGALSVLLVERIRRVSGFASDLLSTGVALPCGAGSADVVAGLLPSPEEPTGILLDLSDRGLYRVGAEHVVDRQRRAFDPDTVETVRVAPGNATQIVPGGEWKSMRGSVEAVARLAVAFEMLGATETLLKAAVDHAKIREQFGRPIGSFQAVQHLLAGAHTDVAAMCSVANAILESGILREPDEEAAMVVKALVGRNACRVARVASQVLGAVGFTWDAGYHRFHRRVLTLDALYGAAADLTAAVGARASARREFPPLLSLSRPALVQVTQ